MRWTCGKLWCLSACKKSTSSLTSFLRYCKNIANLLFWKFWECLTIPIKNHSINFQETFMLICMQQITHSLTFFLRYCKEISSLLFWVIWASLVTPKKIESIWRNFWCLFASKKRTSFFPFSLRYCKDIANLLFWVLFPGKLMTKLSKKSKNPYFGVILGNFFPYLWKNKFSWKKRALTVLRYSNYLPWWEKSEKTGNPFLITELWFHRTLHSSGV